MTSTATASRATPAGPFGAPLPWIHVDGRLVREEDARLSNHAAVISYGTGTFEGIRATWNPEHGELYLNEPLAHYERMRRSARVLGLELPATPAGLVGATCALLRRNEARSDTYLRPLFVLAGEVLPPRLHDVRPRFSIAATPIVGDYIDPRGIRCIVSTWRRAPDTVAPSRAKLCGAYVGPALAKTEAVRRGCDDAIMLNARGDVAEATSSNVLIRRGETWITPSVTDDILEGITRAQVMRLLEERTGRAVVERTVDRSELYVADEMLLCGTAAQIVPVLEVDGRVVGTGATGETTLDLLADLTGILRRTDDRHPEWTTPVYGKGAPR